MAFLPSVPWRWPGVFVVALAVVGAVMALPARRAVQGAAVGAGTYDLAVPDADVVLIGSPNKDQLGNDLALGDVNHDGQLDILAGAQWSSGSGRNIVGRSYVVYGRESWPATLDMLAGGADWSFFGAGRESRLGSAVAVADWDGDGGPDPLLASLLADQLDQHNGGAVYLERGGTGKSGALDFAFATPDALLVGDSRATDSDQLGTDMAVGDLNGDGHDDVAVSAAFRLQETGAVFVWFGPIRPGTVLNLRSDTADWTLLGPGPNSWFGANITVGDVTGSSVPDLIVSSLAVAPAARAGLDYEPTDSGAVYVFAGGPGVGGVLDLATASADTTVVGPPGWKLGVALAVGTCGCTGQSVAVADVTGDGRPDLLAGAPMRDLFTGAVALLAGPLPAGTVGLATSPFASLLGDAVGERFGWSIVPGDLGDGGVTDVVVAAPWATVSGRENAGLVLGLRGPLPALGQRSVSPADGSVAVLGPETGAGNGGCTMALGDTNGDGVADLHVGLPDAAPLGRRSAGAVYILQGPLLMPPTPGPPTWTPTATTAPTETEAPTPTATELATAEEPTATEEPPLPTWTALPTGVPTDEEPTAAADTPLPSPTAPVGPYVAFMPVLARRR